MTLVPWLHKGAGSWCCLSYTFEDCDVFFPQFRNAPGWSQTTHEALEAWVGFEVVNGVQNENGVEYEFQIWNREV